MRGMKMAPKKHKLIAALLGVVGMLLLPSCDLIKVNLGTSKDDGDDITDDDDDDDDDDASDDDDDDEPKKKRNKKRGGRGQKDAHPAPDSGGKELLTGDKQTDAWIEIMRDTLPNEFCKEGSFFRSCFTISVAQCKRIATAQFDPCLKKHLAALPKIRGSETGRRGGEMLGRCAGKEFAEALMKLGKSKDTAKCRDPSAW